jgi:transposase
MKKVTIQIKPYSTKELASMYGVSTRTFRRWAKLLEKHLGKRIGHYYLIPQIEIIFNKLGIPYQKEQDFTVKNLPNWDKLEPIQQN